MQTKQRMDKIEQEKHGLLLVFSEFTSVFRNCWITVFVVLFMIFVLNVI